MPNSEFVLRVLKSVDRGTEPLYTIGIWQKTGTGSELRAICHVEPIDRAIAAIRRELRNAGQSPTPRSTPHERPVSSASSASPPAR